MWQVYKCFAADGRLLYVGFSINPFGRRLPEHQSKAIWFPLLRRVEISEPLAKAEAEKLEGKIIDSERPAFNKNGRTVKRDTSKYYALIKEARMRRDRVKTMRDQGMTLQWIANQLGVSRQRVYQILNNK